MGERSRGLGRLRRGQNLSSRPGQSQRGDTGGGREEAGEAGRRRSGENHGEGRNEAGQSLGVGSGDLSGSPSLHVALEGYKTSWIF